MRRGGEWRDGKIEESPHSEVYLDTVAATNKFISELLHPNATKRFGQLRPGEYRVHDADGGPKSWFDYCGILMSRSPERKGPVGYMVSATKVEPFRFDDSVPMSWRQFVEMVNNHPNLIPDGDDDEDDGYELIDPSSSPRDHDIEFFTTKHFGLRPGQRPRNSTSYGFIVNGLELTFENTSPDDGRKQIRKGMSEEERFMTAKEWEVGSALSTSEMVILLDAMERLGLYRLRRQREVVLPEF